MSGAPLHSKFVNHGIARTSIHPLHVPLHVNQCEMLPALYTPSKKNYETAIDLTSGKTICFFIFCTFCFSTDNKLFENADTAKSRVVQLEIQVAHIQQVRVQLPLHPDFEVLSMTVNAHIHTSDRCRQEGYFAYPAGFSSFCNFHFFPKI